MKCKNCSINIDARFQHAIRTNICPSCGKFIMDKGDLVVYIELQEIISKNFGDIDAEKLSSLLISKFDIRLPTDSHEDAEKVEVKVEKKDKQTEEIESVVEEDPDKEYDQEYKARQMAEAKAKLDKMRNEALREEVYEDALRSQYFPEESYDTDFDFGTEGDPFGNETPQERANRLKQEFERSNKHNKMLSGAGGFTRSDG